MKRFLTLTFVASALVVVVPTTTSAVPPPDVVPTAECAQSGYCPSSLTVDIVQGGEVVGTATCPLILEVTATTTTTVVIGHVILQVEQGVAYCDYGYCGAITVAVHNIIPGVV